MENRVKSDDWYARQPVSRGEKPMREFNIFGPVYPELHYHVDRVAAKAALRTRIAKGRYLTLNAARQTGKTTIFREVIDELAATGEYFGILLDFEGLADFSKEYFYEELGYALNKWRTLAQPAAPEPAPMRHHGDFVRWLRACVQILGKKGVLIIDEFDAVATELIEPILSLFRGMYLEKGRLPNNCIHSVVLVGVRNLPSLLEGAQSPFNIADQFTIPYFSADEIAELFAQYTAETGQTLEPAVLAGIFQETEGQPFLVNRLGQLLTEEIVPDRSQPVTSKALHYALARLNSENNTHFYSIASKAAPYRELLLPLLLYNQQRTDFLDPTTQELIMYGVLRVVEDAQQLQYARIGNPIYRKMLLQRFAPLPESVPLNGAIIHRYLNNGLLDFDRLLDHFKAFMQEHGVRLLKSKKSERPLEISGQYLLFSYLTAALNTIQGYVTIEAVSSAGEIDILAFHGDQRFIVETKIWYDRAKYEEGKAQLVRYLQAASLHKGYLVIFDEHLANNPILTDQSETFEITVDEKVLRIYLVGVEV
jgi:hypothetical protein